MFDPNFNPYDELVVLKHNTQELAKGMNHQSQFLKELAHQHEELTRLLSIHSHQIAELQRAINSLKSQPE